MLFLFVLFLFILILFMLFLRVLFLFVSLLSTLFVYIYFLFIRCFSSSLSQFAQSGRNCFLVAPPAPLISNVSLCRIVSISKSRVKRTEMALLSVTRRTKTLRLRLFENSLCNFRFRATCYNVII